MSHVHQSVNEMSEVYYQNEKRFNYTTPKTFLEQIALYSKLLNEKTKNLKMMIIRLENGLEKLASCAGDVAVLKVIYYSNNRRLWWFLNKYNKRLNNKSMVVRKFLIPPLFYTYRCLRININIRFLNQVLLLVTPQKFALIFMTYLCPGDSCWARNYSKREKQSRRGAHWSGRRWEWEGVQRKSVR